jgi:hypothetical protein
MSFSPARAGSRRSRQGITGVWFQSGLDPEKSSPEILERVETRQHHPESQGGENRNPYDRPKASKWA